MYFNLHREKRLADQRIHDVLCLAKMDCLLRGQLEEAQSLDWKFPVGIFLLPLMIIMLPFRIGALFIKQHWA